MPTMLFNLAITAALIVVLFVMTKASKALAKA
jgi:hypothetical protein